MGGLMMYSKSMADLEDDADIAKSAILRALVADGLLEKKVADTWAKCNTVVIRKKPFFRTITKLWGNTEDKGAHYYVVVKIVTPIPETYGEENDDNS